MEAYGALIIVSILIVVIITALFVIILRAVFMIPTIVHNLKIQSDLLAKIESNQQLILKQNNNYDNI